MAKGSGRTKNLRYGMDDARWENLPGDTPVDDVVREIMGGMDVDNPDAEDIYEVDMDLISGEANTLASSNIQNLLRLYDNKEFMDAHPDFRRRVDTEIESLRKLYKMAKTNEIVHDHLIQSISKNPGNGSLYMALDRLQGKMLSIDQRIRDQIRNFNKHVVTSYQLEMTFKEDNLKGETATSNELEDGSVISRGSKAFIEQMHRQAEEKTTGNQASIFDEPGVTEDELPGGWMVDKETNDVIDEDTGEVVGKMTDGGLVKY